MCNEDISACLINSRIDDGAIAILNGEEKKEKKRQKKAGKGWEGPALWNT